VSSLDRDSFDNGSGSLVDSVNLTIIAGLGGGITRSTIAMPAIDITFGLIALIISAPVSTVTIRTRAVR
jgi:hypothetical protein